MRFLLFHPTHVDVLILKHFEGQIKVRSYFLFQNVA